MERAVASQIIDALMAVERELSVLDVLSDKIDDDQERTILRKGLAQIIVLYTDMLISVLHQYPELDPDPLGGSPRGQ